jgi:hypothetical protein
MPLRSVTITIQHNPERENRDAGKSFVVTEVPALQAEEWGLRAIMALGTSGISVPPEMADAGLIGVVLIGYQAFMGAKPSEVLPLWREMLPACVEYAPSPGIKMPFASQLVEEVSTLLTLRKAILELHTGFTLAEIARRFREATLARQLQNSQATSTSPEQSVPSFL